MFMDSITNAKKHRELRDEEITKKLRETISFLDKEELRYQVLEKVLRKYIPHIEQIQHRVIKQITDDVERDIRERIERISQEISASVIDERIRTEVRDQLRENFSRLTDEI